jgi:hypothetical protein
LEDDARERQISRFTEYFGSIRDRAIIEETTTTLPLYLVVSTSGYQGIWAEDVGQLVIRKVAIKLLVFDVSTESVMQWIE